MESYRTGPAEGYNSGMSISNSLTRLVFPHKAWPYPRTVQQVNQVIIVTAIALLLAVVGIIVGIKYQEQKTLSREDIKLAAQTLTSSSSEMLLIARDSENQPLVQPYREVYVQQLVSSVGQVRQKLSEHDAAPSMKDKAAKLLVVSSTLGNVLDGFAKDSTDETLSGDINQLHALFQQSQDVEEVL